MSLPDNDASLITVQHMIARRRRSNEAARHLAEVVRQLMWRCPGCCAGVFEALQRFDTDYIEPTNG